MKTKGKGLHRPYDVCCEMQAEKLVQDHFASSKDFVEAMLAGGPNGETDRLYSELKQVERRLIKALCRKIRR